MQSELRSGPYNPSGNFFCKPEERQVLHAKRIFRDASLQQILTGSIFISSVMHVFVDHKLFSTCKEYSTAYIRTKPVARRYRSCCKCLNKAILASEEVPDKGGHSFLKPTLNSRSALVACAALTIQHPQLSLICRGGVT